MKPVNILIEFGQEFVEIPLSQKVQQQIINLSKEKEPQFYKTPLKLNNPNFKRK